MNRTAAWALLLIAAFTLSACKDDADAGGSKRRPRAARSADAAPSDGGSEDSSGSSGASLSPRPARPAAAPAQLPGKLKVIADPTQIAAAKKDFAQYQEKKLTESLSNLDNFYRYDEEFMNLLKVHREKAIKLLTATRDSDSKDAQERLQATVLLKQLGVEPDPAKLAQIASSSTEANHMVMAYIRTLFDPKAPLPAVLHPPILAAIDSGDDTARRLAVEIVSRFAMPEAMENIHNRIKNGDPQHALVAAVARAKPDRDTFDMIMGRWGNVVQIDQFYLARGLCNIAESTKDPAVRKEAITKVAEYTKNFGDTAPKYYYTIPTFTVEILATAPPPDEAKKILEDLSRNAQNRTLKSMAIGFLARVDKPLADKIARENIKSPFGEMKAPPPPPGELRDAQAAPLLVKHGIMTKQQTDAALARFNKKRTSPGATRRMDEGPPEAPVAGILWAAKRYFAFGLESFESPVRHDLLILDMATASAGQFKPEAVLENYTEGTGGKGKYTVQFIHGGKLYRFEPQDLEGSYDFPAVLAAVNKALADAKLPEKFITLFGEGKVIELVFAKPEALQAGSEELKLAIATDPAAPRRDLGVLEDMDTDSGVTPASADDDDE